MRVLAELGGYARKDGIADQLHDLYEVLSVMAKGADQAFQLQRETDPRYADPRTDYLLGRREALTRLQSEVIELLGEVGVRYPLSA